MDERFERLEKLTAVFLGIVADLKMDLAILRTDFAELKSDIKTMKLLLTRMKVVVKNQVLYCDKNVTKT